MYGQNYRFAATRLNPATKKSRDGSNRAELKPKQQLSLDSDQATLVPIPSMKECLLHVKRQHLRGRTFIEMPSANVFCGFNSLGAFSSAQMRQTIAVVMQ